MQNLEKKTLRPRPETSETETPKNGSRDAAYLLVTLPKTLSAISASSMKNLASQNIKHFFSSV